MTLEAEFCRENSGVLRGSLYNEFENKDEIFHAAFELYLQNVQTELIKTLQGKGSVKQTIKNALEHMAYAKQWQVTGLFPRKVEGKRGCLVSNTAMEMNPDDEKLVAMTRTALRRLERAFEEAIQKGQESGEIGPQRSAQQLAKFLVSSMQGLAVVAKTSPGKNYMRDVIDVIVSAL